MILSLSRVPLRDRNDQPVLTVAYTPYETVLIKNRSHCIQVPSRNAEESRALELSHFSVFQDSSALLKTTELPETFW